MRIGKHAFNCYAKNMPISFRNRHNSQIVAMINLLFTISTAEGGFVVLLEDMVVHRDHRHHGYGDRLLQYAIDYARQSVGWVERSETHRWAANAGRWVTALRA